MDNAVLSAQGKSLLIELCDKTPEEVESLRISEVVETNGGSRQRMRKWILECFQAPENKEKRYISSNCVLKYLQREKQYEGKVSRAVGDVLGFGFGGLFLKEHSKSRPGQKLYEIPDREKYASWYEADGNAFLGKDYYGPDLEKLIIRQSAKRKKSHFLDHIEKHLHTKKS